MPKYKIGDTVFLEGRRAKVVWLSENANEIEAMDEYIVEFEDRQRQFAISSGLASQEFPTRPQREQNSDCCHGQTY